MRMISKEALQALRKRFPKGTRVELVSMTDPDPVPIGTMGMVQGVNCFGDLEVAWDNSRSLSVIYGEDVCRKVAGSDDQ